MNPTVAAAAIGVSGTVIVGVAGFGAAIWNTRKTIVHARESRVWDRRAAVYVDALVAVNYRQFSRQYAAMPRHPSYTNTRKNAEAYLAAHEQPDWSELEARLQAFASAPVFTAVQASSTAHSAAMGILKIRRLLATLDTSDEDDNAETAKDAVAAAADAEKKWQAAEAADDAVVELIRTELQGRSLPLGDWRPAVPANSASESPR
jgi:hypothetical protein